MQFPEHKASLHLTHNEHKSVYQTVEQSLNDRKDWYEDVNWATETSRQKCIETNELWELQWYPRTPIGSITVCGATLEEVLEFANSEDDKKV